MAKFRFSGVAFVTGVEITVEAHTLGEAVGIIARDEYGQMVELKRGNIEWTWPDLNSGKEVRTKNDGDH